MMYNRVLHVTQQNVNFSNWKMSLYAHNESPIEFFESWHVCITADQGVCSEVMSVYPSPQP